MIDAINHLTLNTRHTRVSPRSEVDPAVIAALSPIVAEGRGGIRGLGLDIKIDIEPGAAAFTFFRPDQDGGYPCVTCVMCWDHAQRIRAWKLINKFGNDFDLSDDQIPMAVPWLAVLLLPPALELSYDVMHMLGDAERCFAWAILDHLGE